MIYNCFISNNPQIPCIGNPSSVFFIENETTEEMSKLAIKAGTPISCFVKQNINYPNSALVTFFAPNGKEEEFCGHGLISVAKALKDKKFLNIKTVLTKSGTLAKLDVLKNGASSLKIPTANFNISKFEDLKTINQIKTSFSLEKEVIEVFKTEKLGDLLFELKDFKALQNLKVQKGKVIKMLKKLGLRIISFFCKGSKFQGIDVEIRVFYVNLKNLEDVVCGSINISVAKILSQKYGIKNYKAIQPFNYFKTSKIGGYQEIYYNSKTEILTLNGFTKLTTEEFILQDINVKFNNNLEPLNQNQDYIFMKELFTNIRVMQMSTAFAMQIPKNEQDLNSFISQLLKSEEKLIKDYGFKKIYSLNYQKYVGVAGVVKTSTNGVVEYGIFLKPEYSGKGIGTKVLNHLFKMAEIRNEIIIGSILKNNYSSIKIAKKNGMIFLNKISKIYDSKVIDIDIYGKYPKAVLWNMLQLDLKNAFITQKITA
jgi:predicted PhzF superfamily epimerase YddE/YHI9/RimJ/RimL family protein N-acetyltransferase